MAAVQVNQPGMEPTDPGYISSITVYSEGVDVELTPDPVTGQVSLDAAAATRLAQLPHRITLISG
jgi:hypothetical protein